MQQATQINDSVKSQSAEAAPTIAPGSQANAFVINLCSSTSPVALAPPDHAGLKRFTFFVSRRREEGRERFRLHMGYFATQEEAEKLLDIVREIYPGAWAGLAPGQRLRARAAAAAAAASVPSGAVTPIEQPIEQPGKQTSEQKGEQQPPPAAAAAPAPELTLAPEPMPRSFAAVAAPATKPAVAAAAEETAARSLSDVRAAIAALDDGSAALRPVLRIPELKAANTQAQTAATPPMAVRDQAPAGVGAQSPGSADAAGVLSGEGAIALLEAAQRPTAASVPNSNNDTTPAAERPAFAVQLIWSVQPIDTAQVPQLAIFSAYTLYGAEGNREGRRWYGLRLGFFTDVVSAKQVAHYVRSEFSTVSVVPVTPRERERARLAASRPQTVPPASAIAAAPAPATEPKSSNRTAAFEFIDDKPVTGPDGRRLLPGPRTGRGAPGKRAKQRHVLQGTKARKLTLEETLEILGAGDLAMDDGRGELLNDDAVAGPATASRSEPKAKSSRLGRLLERLSERIGN